MKNIINVAFADRKTAYVEGLTQWDKGYLLKVTGIEDLDGEVEVHFSLNETGGEAKRALATVENGILTVEIANFILQSGDVVNYNAYAFIYPIEGDTAKTVRKIVFAIEARPKPADWVAPSEKDAFKELIADVNKKAYAGKKVEKKADLPQNASFGVIHETSDEVTADFPIKRLTGRFGDFFQNGGNSIKLVKNKYSDFLETIHTMKYADEDGVNTTKNYAAHIYNADDGSYIGRYVTSKPIAFRIEMENYAEVVSEVSGGAIKGVVIEETTTEGVFSNAKFLLINTSNPTVSSVTIPVVFSIATEGYYDFTYSAGIWLEPMSVKLDDINVTSTAVKTGTGGGETWGADMASYTTKDLWLTAGEHTVTFTITASATRLAKIIDYFEFISHDEFYFEREESETLNLHGYNGSEDDSVSVYLCSSSDANISVNNTKALYYNDEEWVGLNAMEFSEEDVLPSHLNTFRGKYLGDKVTDEQMRVIKNGSFKGLYVGDYWTIGGINWRIVHFDYWYGLGRLDKDTEKMFKHHVVIMPDTVLYHQRMNAEKTTAGGYCDSEMRKRGLNKAKEMINKAFPNMLYDHYDALSKIITDGLVSTGDTSKSPLAWEYVTVEIPSELMMFGTRIHASQNSGLTCQEFSPMSKTQLELFRLRPQYINAFDRYWLNDIVNNEYFASVYFFGNATFSRANKEEEVGVRPVFAIC